MNHIAGPERSARSWRKDRCSGWISNGDIQIRRQSGVSSIGNAQARYVRARVEIGMRWIRRGRGLAVAEIPVVGQGNSFRIDTALARKCDGERRRSRGGRRARAGHWWLISDDVANAPNRRLIGHVRVVET